MTTLVHSFDADGYYEGSAEMPPGAAGVNPEVATLDPLPEFDHTAERLRRVNGAWTVEAIPKPEPEPEPEPLPPQFPRFYGNEKLDLFTPAEQLAIVTATMTDPLVKLAYDRLLGSAYWTYESPETEQGLALLQDKGLLLPTRKVEIVAKMQPSV